MGAGGELVRPVGRRAAARAAGIAALAGGLAMAATPAARAGQGPPVVGSWHARLSSGPNRPEPQVLLVFLPGGVFLQLDSPVEPTASQRDDTATIEYACPNAGQWADDGGVIRVGAIQLNYDAAAAVTSIERMSLALTYDAATDTLSGPRRWRETAADGTELLSTTGSLRATRIPLDP